ncbi:phosphopeptide-binding protein [Flavilitoribacter nigricans]|uniref:Phosphopeptide-binding protein n=1 Tax=Flavilitoribacter nigricans (strain ATCC 23147 / DSM 23189 / NBRC 102662 / NCIMB 1420 / SS-2) TaxID=1122177 RepID=A0A2D0NJ62_FLAN2|nr:phosphopeptide-binding protein [Flavilitoribacter nigricans]PHN08487.1 phosphopeptide-binding protein [Flavilitoribacter nigricans DSM 23189 = NBRC 102662]
MRTLSLLFFVAVFSLAACNNASQPSDSAGDMEDHSDMEAGEMMYTLTPFTPSAEYADASIESMTYEAGKFNFTLGESDYELGVQTPDAEQKMCANSAKGQHIHLIVDNEPYSAQYTADFDYDIADGEHFLLAFLSRSYHESIKTAAASVTEKITVADKAITANEEITEPMLFYSRPKGTYTGKANTEKVMLDFYLANVDLGSEYKVKADINGEIHMIDTWQPYYIEGLPMGENTITLTLVGANDGAVETPLNPVTRTFTLEADPMEEANQ